MSCLALMCGVHACPTPRPVLKSILFCSHGRLAAIVALLLELRSTLFYSSIYNYISRMYFVAQVRPEGSSY